jgi:hypothetical protein
MMGGPMQMVPPNGNPQNCAVINISTNIVVNTIVADPAVDPHSEGTLLVALPEGSTVSFGWKHNSDGTFIDLNPPPDSPAPPQPNLADLQAQLAVIQAQISALVSKG